MKLIGDRHTSNRPRTHQAGLTLVEILVVISIIVVLAMIGFPAFARMRESGKSVVCMGNLKQLGACFITYSAEHNEVILPLQAKNPDGTGGDIWPMALAKAGYLWATPNVGQLPCGKGVWTCPSCDFMSNTYGAYGVVEGIFKYPQLDVPESRMSSIERPSATWLLGDVMQGTDPKKGWYAIWQNPTNWPSNHGPAVKRHGGSRVNVCMFDGHVEALTVKELKDGKYTYSVK